MGYLRIAKLASLYPKLNKCRCNSTLCLNMTNILEHNNCCGCGACFTVCTHDAISMSLDAEGFEYPNIDQDKCIDCGLCKSVCPVLQYDNRHLIRKKNNIAQVGFVARNRDSKQRNISSSGSIFPPIAEWILEHKGIVVGTGFDESWNAVHYIIDKKDDLYKLQGSKYLQCKVDNKTFQIIGRELRSGRKVLYSGLACQVEALKSYLKKEYDNLYTIDLICMGIPSYSVWQKYLEAFFGNEHIKYINFKDKSDGWDKFNFLLVSNKRTFKERGMDNLYLRSMFLSWNMRPSCFICPFKKANRISDFTIADAWGTNKYYKDDDNKGLSSVIVHSAKGLSLWKDLKGEIDSIEVSIDDIAEGNSNLISNKQQSGNRSLFYKQIYTNPKHAFIILCSTPKPSKLKNLFLRIKNRVKSILRV